MKKPGACSVADACREGTACHWVRVALDVPLSSFFDYRHPVALSVGLRVIVPFGRRRLIGMVIENPVVPTIDPAQVKPIERVLDDVVPLTEDWFRLVQFVANYYQRPLGEVMLPALPHLLRTVSAYEGPRSQAGPVARLQQSRRPAAKAVKDAVPQAAEEVAKNTEKNAANHAGVGLNVPVAAVLLNAAQAAAVAAIHALTSFKPVLVYGVTGSGKTEVYLQAALQRLAAGQQVLWMVPEINLTPQLETVLRARLDAVLGADALAVLHSGLTHRERLRAWVRAQRGEARLLLGTRLAIFAPLPALGLIVVDEEHDVSYKQQEGVRYSARDLAIWRARDRNIPVLLGSATPSLESWQHAQQGRYLRLILPARATASSLPRVHLLDTRRMVMKQGLSPPLIEAIGQRLAQGEQSLVFLNRRGYAPALHCASCLWISRCVHCSVFMVLHRNRWPGPLDAAGAHRLQCHHCGHQARVPFACPECGNQDLQPMGQGTQRIEEHLAEIFPSARILRIDADSTRGKGRAQALFASVHQGEIDILIGTQMVAKGHDFTRLSLVGVLNADAMLFVPDFRASERLFAQLMQVAGRAGRHRSGGAVLIQTHYPQEALYQALGRHDYQDFARYTLLERANTQLPPFSYQALLTAEAPDLPHTLAFLQAARALSDGPYQAHFPTADAVIRYDPVPLRVVRVANMARAQLLVESVSRPALQAYLTAWSVLLPHVPTTGRVRWHLEVDPLQI